MHVESSVLAGNGRMMRWSRMRRAAPRRAHVSSRPALTGSRQAGERSCRSKPSRWPAPEGLLAPFSSAGLFASAKIRPRSRRVPGCAPVAGSARLPRGKHRSWAISSTRGGVAHSHTLGAYLSVSFSLCRDHVSAKAPRYRRPRVNVGNFCECRHRAASWAAIICRCCSSSIFRTSSGISRNSRTNSDRASTGRASKACR